MALVALCASATDRFYIEDFTMAAGETCTVSILLDNETPYSAFQADIYMPDGLTIEQEDGDYIFDLTSRKGRDHNIASQLQVDGAIRLMSYSPSIKTYSGNSGALVTFNVTASVDFTGPAIISLRNILFTTAAGLEVPFADETCTVTAPVTLRMGDVNDDGKVDVDDVAALISKVLGNDVSPFVAAAADLNDDNRIDIDDVAALISKILGLT